MLFMDSFPHSGETVSGDEVRETKSRDEKKRRPRKENNGERIIVRLYVPVLWKDSPARPKRFMYMLYNHMLNLLMRSPQGLQLSAYE